MVDLKPRLSPEEYLTLERCAEQKSEYYEGEMFAMAGGSLRHGLLVANLARLLGHDLRERPCFVFSSDVRLQVSPTGLYTYPDVMVACGELRYAEGGQDTLLNPVLLAEVLSPSTANFDRGAKFAHYRTLDSVQHYLLVSQDRHLVELYSRQADGTWLFSTHEDDGGEVPLTALGLALLVGALYDKVDALPLPADATRQDAPPVLTSPPR